MTMIAAPHPIPPTLAKSLHRITADQYHCMIEKGIIADGDPIELLDGFIVDKDRAVLGKDPMSHDPLHALAVKRLIDLAIRVNNSQRHVQIQLPVALTPLYEPEPDAAIIRGTPDDYRSHLPAGADTLCVIEAAHSSLARDQEAKLAAYAAAEIPQYLILNLQSDCVEAYSQPDGSTATYRAKTIAARGQSITLDLGHGATLTVAAADLLP